jgi:hypothetical protein
MSESTRRIQNLASRRRKCLRGASTWRQVGRLVESSWERITCEEAEHRWLCAADRCHTKIIKELETTECH